MAKMLNISTKELAETVFSMSKQERFAKMKQFYTIMYPESKEFYQKFSKQKRKLQSDSQETKPKRAKIENNLDELDKAENKIDYYEDLSTFHDVLDLIEDVDTSKNLNESKNFDLSVEDKSGSVKSEDDDLFEKFMNKEFDHKTRDDVYDNISKKSNNSDVNKPKITKKSPNEPANDKYDKLFDELFKDI